MKQKIRIILVEDEPAILRGLSANITQFSMDYEIVATAYNGIEALKEIKELEPHIVITDICMPMMDGLDLIEAARRENPSIFFVILTGHAEFEYAKRAMKLQVVDYLLKPIDPDALEKLLERLKHKLWEQEERGIRDFLAQELYRDSAKSLESPLAGYTLFLLFAFYGAVTTSMYNELTTGSLIALSSDYGFLDQVSTELNIRLIALRGNYRNETIFALLVDGSCGDSVQLARKAAVRIHRQLQTEDIFLNCILSEPIAYGMDISSYVRNCYLYVASHIIFGQTRLMDYEPMPEQTDNMAVTSGIKELVRFLKPAMSPDEIKSFAGEMVKYWVAQGATQFQIQVDLRFTLNTAVQKANSTNDLFPDPTELLASSASYEELQRNLMFELNKLCAGQKKLSTKITHTQDIAGKVRDYLDLNYTKSFTYKEFTGLFGYHEKYISYIFKEEFGISPSKYILELRMTAAKNLLRQNSNLRLKDVAEAVGYDDQLYFSRVFKNSEGISPKAYQKRQIEEQEVL